MYSVTAVRVGIGVLLLRMFAATAAAQAVHFVSTNSAAPTPPFLSWSTAATNIQDAIDACGFQGDVVLVTDGVYSAGGRVTPGSSLTNRIAVTNAIVVRSVNGPANTFIVGQGPLGDGAIRCAYLTNGAVLSGFTLTNGCTMTAGDASKDCSGGGVFASGAAVSNCIITGNAAYFNGGGAVEGFLTHCTIRGNAAPGYDFHGHVGGEGGGSYRSAVSHGTIVGNSGYLGGGAAYGTVDHSAIASNNAAFSGGGAFQGVVSDSTIVSNVSFLGGGTYGGALNHCVVRDNCADYLGGGMNGGTANRSTLEGNWAPHGGGAYGSALSNCVLRANRAAYGGGARGGLLKNCTVAGNAALNAGGGTCDAAMTNCIVFSNVADTEPNVSGGACAFTCATPGPEGEGNIANDPLFVNAAAGDLHLQSSSPCINAGTNESWMAGAADLDGNPRLFAGGRVDMGCYEYPASVSVIPTNWLASRGLPIDGSVDFEDGDADGMNNWREWRCGTDPTNRGSALVCAASNSAAVPNAVVVSWHSVTGKLYRLERSTNLVAAPPFHVIATNLAGCVESTSFTDTTAVGAGMFLYRVGAE